MILSNDTHIFRFRGDNVNTINELVNNVIWHSKVGGLNDPFEMFFNLDVSALKELEKRDIATLIQKTKFLEKNRKKVEECFFRGDLTPIYNFIYDYWGENFIVGLLEEFHKNVAVACFTKTYDSRLMWGYYGNGMKGICFAYNKEKLIKSDLEFDDVTYSESPPKVNIYKHLVERLRHDQLTISADFSLIKHTDWAKEEEVRSLKFLKGEHVFEHLPGFAVPVKNGCIDAVIIGERLTGDMRNFIENYVEKNSIKLFVARADFTNYKIQIDAAK